ncbi:hypothetical protein K432DRAFT_330535 [Lepidopterella palustris CBS 459.81]|uniref:LCCL domain-containing protein n=1 Tax=Lepidopterella palustris CBS 459.81 TaxID=1314670 RepID=A0A8E2E8S9_9PEZI|nr:hypothetical protein K432DRAFT_330535 [Lepidopterella palustris CBS 459.81]
MPPTLYDSQPSSYHLRDLENGHRRRDPNDGTNSETSASTLLSPVEATPFTRELSSAKATWQRISEWAHGPQPPRPYIIVPFGASIQLVPMKILHTWLPRRRDRLWLLLTFYAFWLLLFIWIIHTGNSDRVDSPQRLSCISRLWPSSGDCGLNGDECRPFENQSFDFRCPAYCRDVKVLNAYAIGAEEINYRSLVIGGPTEPGDKFMNIYRGDSFICGAAIHAGIIDDRSGGCGTITLIGSHKNFSSSEGNGISSVGFNSSFPLSFTFDAKSTTKNTQCKDPQWRAFGVSLVFTTVLSLCTTSSALFFGTVFTSVFFQTALASDPPYSTTYDGVISAAIGRFLPAAFVALFIYQYFVRYTLRKLKAPLERTFLWLGACWVGAIGNHIFDKIPISRLTSHDLLQQPGAITALVFIILLIFGIAVVQAWAFRIEGRLTRYLAIYAILLASILLLLAVPRLSLRIHHYILALLLLPGTILQTRPSLLYQGFLVGLFINGIGRWGFDSILQTATALRTDEKLGSLLPSIPTPIITGENITFSLSLADGYDGISALVNDVERFRRFDERSTTFTWSRAEGVDVEYFRFGFVKYARLGGVLVQDYTRAGVWMDDEWIQMQPGPSK